MSAKKRPIGSSSTKSKNKVQNKVPNNKIDTIEKKTSNFVKETKHDRNDSASTKNSPKHKKKVDKNSNNNGKEAELNKQTHKPASKKQNSQNPRFTKSPSSTNPDKSKDHEILLGQIQSLGGSIEDLELCASSDSDNFNDQSRSTTGNDKNLKKEIENFVESIGLNVEKFHDVSDESDESDESKEETKESIIDNDDQDVGAKAVTTGKPKQHIKALRQWYAVELPPLSNEPPPKKLSDDQIAAKFENAKALLKTENSQYAANHPGHSRSDRTFYTTMIKSGTMKDKLSTLSVLVDESPIHSIHAFETLLGMANKKSRNESVQAVEYIMNLMLESVLPNRKLKYFRDQPLNDPKVTVRHLIVWAFEDFIKNYYYQFIRVIELLSHDVLTHVRQRMVTIIFTLFKEKPEQEQNLLKLLVNKLGDKERKVASRASYLINQIFSVHPFMKMHVIREIEQLILFPSANDRAQYYGVISLNQIILTNRDVEVANKLIDIYFVLFTKLLKSKDDEIKRNKDMIKSNKKKKNDEDKIEDTVDSKLVAALLTGVNRAYKFSQVNDSVFEGHLNVLYRITHVGTFNISIQALMLIYQVSLKKESLSDRFYRALYQSLLDPRLDKSSKHAMYLNLLFKALKNDSVIVRIEAFIKRLIQVCGHHLPPFICGAFYLISALVQKFPSLYYFITHPEDHDSQERFIDVPDEDDLQHNVDDSGDEDKKSDNDKSLSKDENLRKYDGRKRDPQYSYADQTCLWELTFFTNHFHPTVALYAKQLIENKSIENQPELHHHTLSHFLDRFVYRNPKKSDRIKGGNVLLQPTVATEPGMVIMKKGTGISQNEINVNSEEFWKKSLVDVPVDQAFFHKYFTQKHANGNVQKEKKNSVDDIDDFLDPDQESDEELEKEIWETMKSTMPIKLDSDLEDDDDIDDLEDAYFSSDDHSDDDVEEDDNNEFMDDGFESNDFIDDSTSDESENSDGKIRKKIKLKHLPTFASYEDVASLIHK
ncbi:14786_t:CDS:10, partial [Acaulospora morrowiae]